MFLTKLQNLDEKLVHHLEDLKQGKVLFIFDHGLGDYIMFMNLFGYLEKKYPKIKFFLSYNEMFEYGFLHKNMFKIKSKISLNHTTVYFNKTVKEKYDIPSLEKQFDIVVDIILPETPRSLTKMEVCFKHELGFKDEPCPDAGSYKIYHGDVLPVNETNIIGIHAVTNTGISQKSLTIESCRLLWDNITKLGYQPMLFHTKFKASHPDYLAYNFSWVPKQYLISSNNVPDMMNKIAKCKYFFGVLSGPLCLAQSILGDDRCISILRQKYPIETYLHNCKIPTIRSIQFEIIKKILEAVSNKKHYQKIYIDESNIIDNSNIVEIDGELYEKVSTLPKKHPALDKLEGPERIAMIRELNRRGVAPPLETKLVKKVII